MTVGSVALALLGVLLSGPFASPAAAAGHTVRIVDTGTYDSTFRPRSITIRVGDKVSWTNISSSEHNVTFASFGSAAYMSTGARYSHTFSRPGTFDYTCTLHGFSGTVTVSGPTATPKATPKPKPKATPEPTPKPTVKPTSRPTVEPAASPTQGAGSAPPGSSASASPTTVQSIDSVALGVVPSPSEVGGSDGAPTGQAGDATGRTLVILVGLLAIGVVGAGAVVRRRR